MKSAGAMAANIGINMVISFGVTAVISLLIKGLDNLVHANEKAIESAEELRSKYADFFNLYTEQSAKSTQ